MIVALGHVSALEGYAGPGTTQAKEMNFVMNHAPDAGLIIRPGDQQSSVATYGATDAPLFGYISISSSDWCGILKSSVYCSLLLDDLHILAVILETIFCT